MPNVNAGDEPDGSNSPNKPNSPNNPDGPGNPNGPENIVLIGMPGAGKSTVGVVLAKILNYDFVDVDLLIQQRCDKTLQRLIDTLGPLGFIEVENEVLLGLDFDRTIISTGGSAVYSADAIKHLSEIGTIVYLKVGLEELRSRLVDFDERGIVMKREGAMGLTELYDERVPLYEQYADVVVNVDGLGITEAARAIASVVKG